MMKLFLALASVAMLSIAPGISFAGQQAAKTRTATGYSHIMCESEDGTAVCDATAGDGTDIYAIVDMYEKVTFTLWDAGDSSSVCQIFAGTTEDSALESAEPITNYGGDKINSVDLSDTQEKIEFYNINYKYMWVSCSVADAGSKVIMQGSVGRKR
jgi:hypothetical protein